MSLSSDRSPRHLPGVAWFRRPPSLSCSASHQHSSGWPLRHLTPAASTVTFLDVGQGDAILIEGPDGHRILVDGGPSGDAITSALGRRLPFYDRRLDMVVLTHPQQDHLGGLPEVLDLLRSAKRPCEQHSKATPSVYRAWQNALDAHGIAPLAAARGQTIDLGGGAFLSVLSPGSNDESGERQ